MTKVPMSQRNSTSSILVQSLAIIVNQCIKTLMTIANILANQFFFKSVLYPTSQ